MADSPYRSSEKSSYSNPFRSDEKPKRNKAKLESIRGGSGGSSRSGSSRSSTSSRSSSNSRSGGSGGSSGANFSSIDRGAIQVDPQGNEAVASRIGGGVITQAEAVSQSTALQDLQSRGGGSGGRRRNTSTPAQANFNDMQQGAINVPAPQQTQRKSQQAVVQADRPNVFQQFARGLTGDLTTIERPDNSNVPAFARGSEPLFEGEQDYTIASVAGLGVGLAGGGAALRGAQAASQTGRIGTALQAARSNRLASFGLDTARVTASGAAGAAATRRVSEVTTPDDITASEQQLDAAFSAAIRESTTGNGILQDVGGAVSPFFGSPQEFEQVARRELQSQGLRGAELDKAVKEAQRRRTVAGVGEAANLLNIARLTEGVGRANVAQAFNRRAGRQVPKSKAGIETAKQVFLPIAQAGVAEGTASVIAQDLTRQQELNIKSIGLGAGFGGATAGALGSTIAGTAINRQGTSKAIELSTYFLDPFEKGGDLLQDATEKAARRAGRNPPTPTITVMGSQEPQVTFDSSLRSTPINNVPVDLSNANILPQGQVPNSPVIPFSGIGSTTTSDGRGSRRSGRGRSSNTPANILSPVITPTPPTPTPPFTPTQIITGEGTPVPNPVPIPQNPNNPTLTPTQVPVNIPAAVPININIPTNTPLPRIPPPIPLGFPTGTGGRGTIGAGREQFVNELAASQEFLANSLGFNTGFNPQARPKKNSKSKKKGKAPANPFEQFLQGGFI